MAGAGIGAGINAGATLLDGVFNRRFQRRQASQQRQWNIEQAERQFQYDRSMVREMNRYNAPAAQMERFRQAGLNPNLIYGQGEPGLQSELPKYQEQATDIMSQQPMYNFGQAANNVVDSINQYQRVKLNNEQIEQQRIKTERDQIDLQYERWRNAPRTIVTVNPRTGEPIRKEKTSFAQHKIWLDSWTADAANQNAFYQRQILKEQKELTVAQKKLSRATAARQRQEIGESGERIKLMQQQVAESKQKIENWKADINRIKTEAVKLGADIEYVKMKTATGDNPTLKTLEALGLTELGATAPLLDIPRNLKYENTEPGQKRQRLSKWQRRIYEAGQAHRNRRGYTWPFFD